MLKKDQLTDQIHRWMREANRIAICGHLNPDGDCLGSVTGLGRVLMDQGHEVTCIAYQPPDHLSYLPDFSLLQEAKEDETYDLFIMVDVGDRKRIGAGVHALDNSKHSICIDHHLTNDHPCERNLVIAEASSTCQILSEFLQAYGDPISKNAATSLYTGLITDTNRFLYDSSRREAMRVGASLLEAGADADLVYLREYQSISPKLFSFQGRTVDHAKSLQDGKIMLARVDQKDLDASGLTMSQAESSVEVLRDLAGVELAVLVKEFEPGQQKLSFRSKEYFDVARLAQSLGGGGHRKAAGATVSGSMDEVYDKMEKILSNVELAR